METENTKPEKQPEVNNAKEDVPGEQAPPIFNNSEDKGAKADHNDRTQKNKTKEIRNININSPIVVKIAEEKKKWGIKTYMEITALIIGGLVLWVTYATFDETRRSVNISALAFEDSRRKDSISDVMERAKDSILNKRYEVSRMMDSIIMGFSGKTLDAQLSAFKEAQNRFEIENMPNLQISTLSFRYIKDHKNIRLKYTIKNLGKYPARTLSTRTLLKGVL